MHRRGLAALVVLVSLTVGCAAKAGPPSTVASRVRVFASTDVWACVVQAIGGPQVEVASAISRPGQDPHDYEATLRDKLAVSRAAIVIYNGGGYDDWAAQLSRSTPGERRVIDAVGASGVDTSSRGAAAAPGQVNEHVFYDFAAVARVGGAVVSALSAADPAHRAAFRARAKHFDRDLRSLSNEAARIGAAHPGLTAVATEPIAGYLLQEIGIRDVTPPGYVEQSESDAGPSALVRQQTVDVIASGRAKLLVRDAQTEDQVSLRLEVAARTRHVPEVQIAETLPDGITTYRGFAQSALAAFADAAGVA
jgi:zinc/manganese transport system substrate-binding protein